MKKRTIRTSIKEVTNYVDQETGELIDRDLKLHKYMVSSKDEFFLCYSAVLGVLEDLTPVEVKVFSSLLQYVKNVEFDISKRIRISMAEKLGLNERTILNALPMLVEKELLIQNENKLYRINPIYAFQGSTFDREDAVRAVIELKYKMPTND